MKNSPADRYAHDDASRPALPTHPIESESSNEELRKARMEIETWRARYFDLYDLAPVGYCTLSEPGLILEANQTVASLLGTTRSELITRPLSDFIAQEDQDTYHLHQKKLFETGAACECELRLIKSDGTTIWSRFTASVVREDDDAPVCRVAMRDFTERTHADITHIKEIAEALKTSEMRFKSLLQNVPTVAVQGYAMDGTVRYWNRASETFYGFTAEEAIGRNLLDLIIPPAMRHVVRAAVRRMVATGKEIPASEMELMRKDGSAIPIYSSHALVQLPGQEPELFCIDIDLTERKRAEAEQHMLQAQFIQAQKMEAVGHLAGGVAHDFNNLLMGIMGYTELCHGEVAPDHPIREYLDEIKTAAQKSAEITRQLLAFARKQPIQPRVLDLNETMGGMLKLLRRLIGEDIKLVWRPGVDLPRVKVDPVQVDQILVNVCINARDAIGGVGEIALETGSVTLGAEHRTQHPESIPGEYVCLTISDNGCGMDKDTLKQIFDPFFTTKGVGKGTGLGLATVYGIVKQNNGFIYAYSEPGLGTSFRIYLPAMAAEDEVSVTDAAEVPAGRGETVLVVEDEPSVRTTCSRYLEGLGYTPLAAETPGEALSIAKQHGNDIDLLLTDVVMPGMDGRQLAQRIGMVTPGIKVMFMSGYTADEIGRRGVLEEGVRFIAKPFTRETLARKVREALDTD